MQEAFRQDSGVASLTNRCQQGVQANIFLIWGCRKLVKEAKRPGCWLLSWYGLAPSSRSAMGPKWSANARRLLSVVVGAATVLVSLSVVYLPVSGIARALSPRTMIRPALRRFLGIFPVTCNHLLHQRLRLLYFFSESPQLLLRGFLRLLLRRRRR